jgi:hypothetical protein
MKNATNARSSSTACLVACCTGSREATSWDSTKPKDACAMVLSAPAHEAAENEGTHALNDPQEGGRIGLWEPPRGVHFMHKQWDSAGSQFLDQKMR